MATAIVLLCTACAGDGASRKSDVPAKTARNSSTAKSSDPSVNCSVERAVGTNIPKKTCMTAGQREAARKQAAEAVGGLQRSGGTGNRESGL
ncbi:MAG: hypothetical protein WC809_13715 [Sinimarinibacterium sp.]|jgi:hypothetical protein